MSNKEFYVGKKPPINFSLNVIATDVSLDDKRFKLKIVFDFVPTFTPEPKPDTPNFHGNKVYKLMKFISDRVIKKVIEFVYYDRDNESYCKANKLRLPDGYSEAMKIYDERLKRKKTAKNGDSSYLDYCEERSNAKDGYCIHDIIDTFFNNPGRPVWIKENNVTRITYQELSPPSLTVETRTAVNGDKKPK